MYQGQSEGMMIGSAKVASQAMSGSTRDLPPAATAVNQLREMISRLDVEVSGLIDRIVPVMRPEMPQNDCQPKEMGVGQSMIVQEITDQTNRLASLVRRVQEAASRLEI